MAYVPPHLRSNAKSNVANLKKDVKDVKGVKKVEEFPVLAPVNKKSESTMDFKKIFEKRREMRKKRRQLKSGWICFTKNGVIDSMTPEQRENNRKYYENRRIAFQMEKFAARIDRDIDRRMEYEDLSPEELVFSSSSEESQESEEEYVEDAEEIDDRF